MVRMILIGLLCAIWMVPIWQAPSFVSAETGTVIIASDTSVQVGDSMKVTVKYAASGLGLVDGELRYDPDMLKYVSGGTSADPSGGVIKMKKEMAGETSLIFTMRFQVVGTGSDFFLVNTFELKDGAGNDLGKPGASVKLVASKPADTTDSQEPDDSIVAPDDPTENPTIETPDNDGESDGEETGTDGDSASDLDAGGTDEDTNEKAPDTLWVFVGAIAATTVLLALSLIVVRRRRKSE